MKPFYYLDPQGNFGDDLNAWLWPRVIPEVLDSDEDNLFVGIGTLINDKLPRHGIKHIVGSGVGYGQLPPIGDDFVFHAVRGFNSAKALGLPPEKVITDSAVLIRTVDLPRGNTTRHRSGLMLTGQSLYNYDWESVCQSIGIRFISCHWDVERVLREITQCDTLMTEAMHGAIVADALRVPWVPVICSNIVLEFKWRDWLSSLNLAYEPHQITRLYDVDRWHGIGGRMKNTVKRMAEQARLFRNTWGEVPAWKSNSSDVDSAKRELLFAAQHEGILSEDHIIVEHTERYMAVLDSIRAMHASQSKR